MTNEELKAAICIVQHHQDWRRGAEIVKAARWVAELQKGD